MPRTLIAIVTLTRRLLLALALAALASPAQAFDCAKATSRSEKAICGDARAKDADAAMSKAFSDLIASANVQRIEQTIVGVDSRRQLIAFGTNATYRFTRSLSIAAAINDNISHKTGANFGTPFSEVYGTLSVTIRR